MDNWPPPGFDPSLPADSQGMFDPGNDDDEILNEDGDPVDLADAFDEIEEPLIEENI